MKAIKKMAAVIAAVTMAVGVMAISSFAADDTYKLYVETEKASVGDIVPVSVVLDSNKEVGVGGISFKLNYNPEELELQKDTVAEGSALKGWSGSINTNQDGVIGFGYTVEGTGVTDTGAEILSMSFKVLKVNSSITLTDTDVAADDFDGSDLNENVTVYGAKVECSHKNTDIKTEIEDCEKGGKTVTACKDCGETVKTEAVAPAEHKIDKWTETKKATCAEKGEEEGVCTVCGKTVTRETEMIDHSFGEWKVTTPATCTEKGVETSTCSSCGKAQTREIDALGHDFGEWTVVKEATCTEAGEKTETCTACGNEETEEIPALGHDWGEWKVVEEATTEKEGSEERECGRCGEKETRVIDKLAPVETDEITTSPDPAVTTSPNGSSNNGSGSGNPATGVALAIIPLVAAGAAAVVFCKKRK